jgi:hypothetical protein
MVNEAVLPNSKDELSKKVRAGQIKMGWPVALLFSRISFFIFFQAIIAAIFALTGNPAPWRASTAWWVISATLTNFVSIGLLAWRARREGMRLVDIYRVGKHKIWVELLWGLGFLVVSAPLFVLPNVGFANLFFGGSAIPNAILAQPLPFWVLIPLLVLFPVSIAFAEIPTYFSYSMKRIDLLSGKGWLAILLAVFFLAFQHIALPLVFDWRFITFRFLCFLPFAALLGVLLYFRPRQLPYVMVIHALLDLATVIALLPLAIK